MDQKEKRRQEIDELCDEAGCSDKIRKIHFEQFVHRHWHPHPPKEFKDWWVCQHECEQGMSVARAYNCQIYHQRFLEEKAVGAA